MAKITATKKQYEKLLSLVDSCDDLSAEIQTAGSVLVVDDKELFVLSNNDLYKLIKKADELTSKIDKFIKKEVNPWV